MYPTLADVSASQGASPDTAGIAVAVYGFALAFVSPVSGLTGGRIDRLTPMRLNLAMFALSTGVSFVSWVSSQAVKVQS